MMKDSEHSYGLNSVQTTLAILLTYFSQLIPWRDVNFLSMLGIFFHVQPHFFYQDQEYS